MELINIMSDITLYPQNLHKVKGFYYLHFTDGNGRAEKLILNIFSWMSSWGVCNFLFFSVLGTV